MENQTKKSRLESLETQLEEYVSVRRFVLLLCASFAHDSLQGSCARPEREYRQRCKARASDPSQRDCSSRRSERAQRLLSLHAHLRLCTLCEAYRDRPLLALLCQLCALSCVNLSTRRRRRRTTSYSPSVNELSPLSLLSFFFPGSSSAHLARSFEESEQSSIWCRRQST